MNMKPKNCLNDFIIMVKLPDESNWQTEVECIATPITLTLGISASDPQKTIKKISWDFGTGNQIKNITNRKQELNEYGINCKYKRSHNSTITIQASVYTDSQIYIPQPIITTTINHILKAHYIDPEEFKRQIMTYYETNIFTDDVAESIYKIANRLAFASNFINYTYRDDMIGDAVVRMIEALTTQKFDPLKGNPFSYFTKIAFHAFCNRIKREKKVRDTLANYQNDIYGGMQNGNNFSGNMPDHDQEFDHVNDNDAI